LQKNLLDTELISLYKQQRDKAYVGELFTRYTDFVFSVSLKYLQNQEESKDAVMQIFEKLFDSLLSHEVSNFKSWLYSVTKNHCYQILRDKQKNKEISIESEHFSDFNMENEDKMHLDEKLRLEQKLEMFEEQLAGLSEEQRICIELFYLKKRCYQEITEKTGFSLKQVKSFIQNGKRNLQLRLTKQ